MWIFLEDGIGAGESVIVFVTTLFPFILLVGGYAITYRVIRHRIIPYLFGLGFGIYYLFQYFQILYWMVTGGPIDWYFVSDSKSEVIPTLMDTFGPMAFWLVIGGLLVLLVILSLVAARALRHIRGVRLSKGELTIALLIICGTSFWQQPESVAASSEAQGIPDLFEAREIVEAIMPNYSHEKVKSTENIFVVQLESTNGLATSGFVTDEGTDAYHKYLPELTKIATERGVFFPRFWGNAIQTNRAQASILCGITNNIGKGLSHRLEEIDGSSCLPSILSESGYDTVLMNAHPKPTFHNVDSFMKHIGMKDLHHGDMMKAGDKKFAWGFADDIFYKRSLEYLKETYGPKPEKLMAYFKVSMNHTNFPSREEFKTAWPFKEPDEFIEKYLNSVASQDFCLKEFMKGYEDFANNTHLFIMSDTSWPVGINGNRWNEKGANTDNFIIPFAYIPPQNRSDEFSIGSINTGLKYSQTDFVPTVMELLNGETEQNSFAHVLKKKKDNELVASLKSFGMDRGEKDYETCHVLVQPYAGPKVSIVKGRYKYIYEVEEERLTKFNLTTDLLEQNPEIVSEDMSYEEFRNNYYCKRYN